MGARPSEPGRLLVGPLVFVVSPEERTRLATVGTISATSKRVRGFGVVNGLVTFANGVLQTLLGLGAVEPRTPMASIHLIVGIACLIASPFFFFGRTRSRPLFSRSRLSSVGARSFAVYEGGITLDRPASLVPWSRVRSIVDIGEAFVVKTTFRRRVLPKRIFDDGGEAFWAYAASRIVSGGRMLVVPVNRRMLRNSVVP